VLTPLGDLESELTLIARYVLAELDSESDLLRIIASEARNRPHLLTTAVNELVSTTFTGFASWISERAGESISAEQADALSSVGLGALLSSRLLRDVLGVPVQTDDQTLIDVWVRVMLDALSNFSS